MGIWAFHGVDDRVRGYAYQNGLDAYQAILKCSLKHPPRFTAYVNTKHDSWTQTYANTHGQKHTGGDGKSHENIYQWMLSF